MRAWLEYGAAGAVVVLVGAGLAMLIVGADAEPAIWFAAGLAWVLQLIAFAALLAARQRPNRFLLGWVGGLVLRFGAVGAVAFWLARDPVFPQAPALLSLVAFVFLLLLLEPLFLRRSLQAR